MSMDRERMELVAGAESTISGKIRALGRAGFKRADIARFLNRRYQHVRNVLEAEMHRTAANSNHVQVEKSAHRADGGSQSLRNLAGKADRPDPPVPAIFRLRTNADGGLLIPAHMLARMAVGADEVVIARAERDRLALTSAAASMRRAQELVATLLPGADSLADALIADRRREVEEERIDG